MLVAGGAGFIGSNIVRRAARAGPHAGGARRPVQRLRRNLMPEGTVLEADVRDGEAVLGAAHGCDVIIHLAASVGNARSIDDPVKDSQINVVGTLNVLQAARRHRLPRIVFSSSAGIFGELKTLPLPRPPRTPTRLTAQASWPLKRCASCSTSSTAWATCACATSTCTADQRYDAYGNVIPIFADRILRGVPMTIFGDGEQTRDFVNARDVAAANIAAATADPGVQGAFNIGSATRVTISGVAATMQRLAAYVKSASSTHRPRAPRATCATASPPHRLRRRLPSACGARVRARRRARRGARA